MSTPQFRINHQIPASSVRLLREDGTQVGVVAKDEALLQAKTAGVDLVEVAPHATPPVVKLIDYKKFLYQLAKKARQDKAATKRTDLKEIRLTPFMAQNDFATRLRQGREFLTQGRKLKLSVKFVGRQLTHKEFADIMWNKAVSALSDTAAIDQPPKWLGKIYCGTLTPAKKK